MAVKNEGQEFMKYTRRTRLWTRMREALRYTSHASEEVLVVTNDALINVRDAPPMANHYMSKHEETKPSVTFRSCSWQYKEYSVRQQMECSLSCSDVSGDWRVR